MYRRIFRKSSIADGAMIRRFGLIALSFVHDVFEEIRGTRVFFAKTRFNLRVGCLNVLAKGLDFQLVVGKHANAGPHGLGLRAKPAVADEI
jgi:hypothetical protein